MQPVLPRVKQDRDRDDVRAIPIAARWLARAARLPTPR
jgi:hypothetical protein